MNDWIASNLVSIALTIDILIMVAFCCWPLRKKETT